MPCIGFGEHLLVVTWVGGSYVDDTNDRAIDVLVSCEVFSSFTNVKVTRLTSRVLVLCR